MSDKVIGLAGTFASGKDTLAQYLETEHEFRHVSTGDLIREEAYRRGKTLERADLVKLGNDLRKERGPGILVERAINENQLAANLVISGIRAVAEGQAIKDGGGTLIFLDAPVEQRYKRLRARGRIGDETSLEQFVASENRELSTDTNYNQNISGVRIIADSEIINDRSQDELFLAVRGLLAQL